MINNAKRIQSTVAVSKIQTARFPAAMHAAAAHHLPLLLLLPAPYCAVLTAQ
jgi:hypothetical protein